MISSLSNRSDTVTPGVYQQDPLMLETLYIRAASEPAFSPRGGRTLPGRAAISHGRVWRMPVRHSQGYCKPANSCQMVSFLRAATSGFTPMSLTMLSSTPEPDTHWRPSKCVFLLCSELPSKGLTSALAVHHLNRFAMVFAS